MDGLGAGQAPRELRENALGWEVSPDGMRIAFSPTASGLSRELWVIGSQGDGPQRVLALGENEWLDNVHWSPDGQRLAYMREWKRRISGGMARGATIETCDLKGSNQTLVLPDEDVGPNDFRWLPGGRIVYARLDSPDSDDDNPWQVGVNARTGTPTDKPKRISQWDGSYVGVLSASADGKRLALIRTMNQSQVYVGELAAGGSRMSPPRPLRSQETDDRPTGWTADSKAVLFDSFSNGTSSIFRQGISGDTADLLVNQRQPAVTPLWPRLSPDGACIVYA